MKVSYKWLQEYVDIDLSPEDLGNALTMAGIEVEHITCFGQEIKGVVIGEILKIIPHPEADKLVICQVNLGQETVQIITGATNVQEGQRIPVAPVGAVLPGGIKMKKAKLRGLDSFGMLCSAGELNLDETLVSPESKDGIMILSPESPIGEDIVSWLNLDDAVLELSLTPNRSDCLSVINIAREIGTILKKPVRLPEINLAEGKENIEDLASVEVLDPDLCNRYAARLVKNVKLKPSPPWMQHYLRAAGIRSINNVVDISNYVMLETGQPLHTFDYDTLSGHKIIVRRAHEGEKMFTLDGQERIFNRENLLICDEKKPVAVAGVMGGLNTEVTEQTHHILIESARFDPAAIRHTSKDLGLRSESSLRFEKGLDVYSTIIAVQRAAQLMAELAEGEVVQGVLDVRGNLPEETVLTLRVQKVNELLGTALRQEEILAIIDDLKFSWEMAGSEIRVIIPSYRQDITREVDLIEEVARLHGYEKIPLTLPAGRMTEGKKTEFQNFEDQVKNYLTGAGFMEVITYSFISPRDYDRMMIPDDSSLRNGVVIMNPISDAQSVMRTTLIPGLLETASRNTNRRNLNFAFYEWGKIFIPGNEKLPQEPMMLGGVISGKLSQGWSRSPQNLDFYYLKGVLDGLFARFGIENWSLKGESLPVFLHPGRSGNIYIGDTYVGFIGEIHPAVQENYHLESRSYIFQVYVEEIMHLGKNTLCYQAVPKYPAIDRDMALLVKEEIPAQLIEEIIRQNGGTLLTGITLFDLYKGSQIPEGFKSLAYALTFQSKEKTLTDDEISPVFQKIQNELLNKFDVELR
ncbi:phenylalanine--tRNA ligase subunit beta [Dehalobacterium formicoaceticum]|uniref:Phenylalanine--tRNA ligase beta subunit n=1 Tax=Dehalobacterium formicoaceticum TaxID=51515 RepID=A0ABT1Y7G4_9FIRM|nr:phenylalanine--tRNA ligase subunit beta [Dehalobacterium formicoaceticum]MCR6546824.1 phenylalanine--tRNA ligase subunit beta [Dehalobacterium formicoaceticum]